MYLNNTWETSKDTVHDRKGHQKTVFPTFENLRGALFNLVGKSMADQEKFTPDCEEVKALFLSLYKHSTAHVRAPETSKNAFPLAGFTRHSTVLHTFGQRLVFRVYSKFRQLQFGRFVEFAEG